MALKTLPPLLALAPPSGLARQGRGDGSGSFSAWYSHRKWRATRLRQLQTEPLCRFCERQGRTTLATVADHITPHRGDRHAFFYGPLQSLCKHCHDSAKQAFERQGLGG